MNLEFSRKAIIASLQTYLERLLRDFGPLSKEEVNKEKETIARFQSFLNSAKKPFSRMNLPGHFCGSAWVLDRSFKRIVLTHHAKLGKWIQLGGHADDDMDLFEVALKEAKEESGLRNITGLQDKDSKCIPFDFSIHEIPENKGVPAHLHFDVTYVFVAEDENLICSDESFDVRWFSFDEAMKVCNPESVYQLRKLQFLVAHHLDKT
jgi:8-oxo-dGTP pyrophosphatase MutT (NUDIX family)